MRKVLFISTVVIFAVAAILLTLVPSQSQDKSMKLRMTVMWPPQHWCTKLLTEMGNDIEKATAGRVSVTVFPSSTLSPPMQVYDNTVKGVVDIGTSLLAYSPGRLPLSEVLQQPLGFRNGYQSTKCANEYYKQFKPKEFDDVKVMLLHAASPGFFMTKNPVKSLAEVKGKRIKANAENVDIVKALDASPVTMTVAETYDGLSRGIVDGTLFPIEALQGFKIGEVVKTVIEDYGMSYGTSMYVVMNKEKWNSISPADQKAIDKISAQYVDKIGKGWVGADNAAKKFAEGKGVTFVKVSEKDIAATAAKMKPIWAKYVEMTKSKGLPGDKALKFCQDFIKKNK